MAKYYNNIKKTGRVGGSVFAIRNGVTIERAYNPIVANPSTQAQMEARAKLKLMSQISAVLAPYIAMQRVGLVSRRNLFTKVNYPAAVFQNDAAEINVVDIKLTAGVVGLPDLVATPSESGLGVRLASPVAGLTKVVYVAVVRQGDGAMRVLGSAMATAASTDPDNFAASIAPRSFLPTTVLAYGIRINSAAVRAKFDDLVETAEQVATIATALMVTSSDIIFTETRGVTVSE